MRLLRARPRTAPVDESESLLVAITRYARHERKLRRGNAVRPLRTGAEAFPAMLAAIAAATRTICLETYIVEADRTGQRFADALCERAAAGVTVRFLFDALGGFGITGEYLQRLRDSGVEVMAWNPLAPWGAALPWSHRDHKKILVVDDQLAFTGGLNLGDEYAAIEDGGKGWHDVHCELRGPIVRDLARLFRATWLKAGGSAYPAPPSADEPGQPRAGQVAARVIDNSKRRQRGASAIRRAYLRAIRAAQKTIYLENAYFLPDRGLRIALRKAVRRGVDVAVIVPGASDVRTVKYAGYYLHKWMVDGGVRMLRWTGPMMHAKTGVIDGVWSTIGSYNLDSRSLRYNLELTVEIIDADVGARMEAAWREDERQTVPYDAGAWARLAWWQRWLAWFLCQFRRLL